MTTPPIGQGPLAPPSPKHAEKTTGIGSDPLKSESVKKTAHETAVSHDVAPSSDKPRRVTPDSAPPPQPAASGGTAAVAQPPNITQKYWDQFNRAQHKSDAQRDSIFSCFDAIGTAQTVEDAWALYTAGVAMAKIRGISSQMQCRINGAETALLSQISQFQRGEELIENILGIARKALQVHPNFALQLIGTLRQQRWKPIEWPLVEPTVFKAEREIIDALYSMSREQILQNMGSPKEADELALLLHAQLPKAISTHPGLPYNVTPQCDAALKTYKQQFEAALATEDYPAAWQACVSCFNAAKNPNASVTIEEAWAFFNQGITMAQNIQSHLDPSLSQTTINNAADALFERITTNPYHTFLHALEIAEMAVHTRPAFANRLVTWLSGQNYAKTLLDTRDFDARLQAITIAQKPEGKET